MAQLALELGTEEMPAGAIRAALDQLRSSIARALIELRLPAEAVHVYGTPRRLIAFATEVPARQPDQQREARGPAVAVAYGADGAPTGAAIGFARKQGVAVDALRRERVGDGEYVFADVLDQGKPSVDVLGPALAAALRGLEFPKLMRWGDQREGGFRYVRPVRWILCLLDGDVVPMEFAGVASGRETRGHRFLSPQPFDVPEAPDLFQMLHMAGVMVDRDERRREIVGAAQALAAEAGGRIPWDEELLEENVFLVEWPTALLGSFDSSYLSLPRPVLVTAMKKHQRFFPVEDDGGSLLARFVSIRNGGAEHRDTVREGNERVLTARFADARFFHDQDRTTSLDAMSAGLERLLFQDKLGTMAHKRARLVLLVGHLADAMSMPVEVKSNAVRAASLCKADLVSRMVIELPALQGVMGREYALAQGEPQPVADAIGEHYRPRSAGDELPTTHIGRLLAVADRLDTLVGYVGLGTLPTGSSDPYGLRRAAQGAVQILSTEPEMPSLVEIEVMAARAYQQVNELDFPLDPLCNDLAAIFQQRLAAQLEDRAVRYDLIDAALSGGSMYNTRVYAAVQRGEALQRVASDKGFVSNVQAAARVANILRSAGASEEGPLVPGKEAIHGTASGVERAVSALEQAGRGIDAAGLADPAEKELFKTAQSLLPTVAHRAAEFEYVGVYDALGALRQPVNSFFDAVLVMADDPAVRANRLQLLRLVDTLYKTLADFTKVVVA